MEQGSSHPLLINAHHGNKDLSILEVIESECKPSVGKQGAFSIG